MIFDPMYFLFIVPPILLMLYAQHRVKSTFSKYGKVPNRRMMSGAEVARKLLDENGLYDVPVESVPGELSDHYDPRTRALRLSPPVYNGRTVAALGIAAHETGHAIQHQVGYAPLTIRAALVPVASFGSNLAPIMLIAGVIMQFSPLAWLGLAFFAAATLFALVTLPVEFNASSRAMTLLTDAGVMDWNEAQQNREVLNAAALTYIAGFLAALMQLLYWVMIVTGGRR